MKQLLLSAQGRINRAAFWKGIGILAAISVAMAVINMILVRIAPHQTMADGTEQVSTLVAVSLVLIGFVVSIVQLIAVFCLAIKRYHDRDKSGWWVLIGFVPLVGWVWYFVETGCLPGTFGANRFGPDPLSGMARSASAVSI